MSWKTVRRRRERRTFACSGMRDERRQGKSRHFAASCDGTAREDGGGEAEGEDKATGRRGSPRKNSRGIIGVRTEGRHRGMVSSRFRQRRRSRNEDGMRDERRQGKSRHFAASCGGRRAKTAAVGQDGRTRRRDGAEAAGRPVQGAMFKKTVRRFIGARRHSGGRGRGEAVKRQLWRRRGGGSRFGAGRKNGRDTTPARHDVAAKSPRYSASGAWVRRSSS